MNPTELKELAEWSAEFLGLLKIEDADGWELPWNNHEWLIVPNNFFGGPFAPILMDLGKREMEKREMNMDYCFRKGTHSVSFMCGPVTHDTNEYIAFWSAVMQAIKEE